MNTATAFVLPPKDTAPKSMEASLTEILTEQAVIIEPVIKFPGMRMGLKPADLGLVEGQYDPKSMNLGTLDLFKEDHDEIMDPGHRIRKNVSSYIASKSNTFMDKNLIPNQNLVEVCEKIEGFKQEFNDWKTKVLSEYIDRREKAIAGWKAWAYTNPQLDFDQAEALVARVTGKFFPLHVMERKFSMHYHPFSCATAPLLKEKLTTLSEQRHVLDARNAIVKKAMQESESEVHDFIKQVTRSIRLTAVETIEKMIEAIQSGEWNQKTLNRFDNIYDAMSSLSYTGGEQTDLDLLKRLKEFEDKYLKNTKAGDYKKDAGKMSDLTEAMNGLKASVAELAEQDAEEAVAQFKAVGARKFNLG